MVDHASAAQRDLPELPKPLAMVAQFHGEWRETTGTAAQPIYDVHQMREYARQAVYEAEDRASRASAGAQWLPIESAPNSAERLLVFNQGGRIAMETGHYVRNMMRAALIDGEECHFTHWQPLPPPPAPNLSPATPRPDDVSHKAGNCDTSAVKGGTWDA